MPYEKVGKEFNLMQALEVTQKLGQDLLREALTQRAQAQKGQVIMEVNTIMARLEVMQRLEEKTQKRLQWCKDQLQAINDGEFTISERTGRIRFNNEQLNVTWDSTESW